jgi:hypothetical protein
LAGQPLELLTGGSGAYSNPAAGIVAKPSANGTMTRAARSQQPHHGVIGMVLLAVLILIALDRAGFKFAVTAGRR